MHKFFRNSVIYRVGVNGPSIVNHTLRVFWSHDRWDDITLP